MILPFWATTSTPARVAQTDFKYGAPTPRATRLITGKGCSTDGAGRGALNQGAVAMHAFNGALYIGTGIQNGGYDWRNKIGPAAAEIIRLNANGSWDIVVGNPRDGKRPLSEMFAGFNNFFAGYIWRFGVHDGWLYAGTMDWGTDLEIYQSQKEAAENLSTPCRGGS